MDNKKKRIIDERGRLFGKVSVVDLAVVLIVVVMAVAYYARSNSGSGTRTASLTEVTYSLTVHEVRTSTVNLIRVGDIVYDEHGVNLGTVVAVENFASEIKSPILDGSYVSAISEGKYDVRMTLNVGCAIADGHYYADRKTELSIGAVLPIATKYVKTNASITSID